MTIESYVEKEIQTSMAQGWSTQISSMTNWIQTSRLSMKNSLCDTLTVVVHARQLRSGHLRSGNRVFRVSAFSCYKSDVPSGHGV